MRGSEETVLNKLDAVHNISSRIEDRANTLVYMVSQENRSRIYWVALIVAIVKIDPAYKCDIWGHRTNS